MEPSRVTKEISDTQRKDRTTVKADAELMQSLLKHPGWPRYMAMIEAVGQNFNNQLMQPLGNVMEVTKSEYAKGALTGLSVAASLPSAKIREANDLSPNQSADDEGNE